MATKLKRVQALAAQTPSIGRVGAAARRGGSEDSRRRPPRPEPETSGYTFNLADVIRNMGIGVVSKGVVVSPPKPKCLVIEVTLELPLDTLGH